MLPARAQVPQRLLEHCSHPMLGADSIFQTGQVDQYLRQRDCQRRLEHVQVENSSRNLAERYPPFDPCAVCSS